MSNYTRTNDLQIISFKEEKKITQEYELRSATDSNSLAKNYFTAFKGKDKLWKFKIAEYPSKTN